MTFLVSTLASLCRFCVRPPLANTGHVLSQQLEQELIIFKVNRLVGFFLINGLKVQTTLSSRVYIFFSDLLY